ncbi:MAG: hypothetical protein Q8O25_06310 [Sulfurisoma sp.]|nr:hypothetical protein [Sulfurisoma sp.]
MKHAFKFTTLAASLMIAFQTQAESLPDSVNQMAQQAGVVVNTDGSIEVAGTRYVTLFPANYDPATPLQSNAVVDSNGSVTWGYLQFVPIVDDPMEMPHFPAGFVPNPGLSLPADFVPPAGFVPLATLPIPPGVTVPPLTPQQMTSRLEAAGVLPAGMVEFQSDGSLKVNGVGNYLPFMPATALQGQIKDPNQTSIQIGTDGTVIFPDGTTFAPIVPGALAGEVTLPANFVPPTGTALPSTVVLPPQFAIPFNMPIPPGMTLPPGVSIPEHYTIPSGTILPPGVNIPASVTLPLGVSVPEGFMLPAGTQFGTTALPEGTTILPNGSVVMPGTAIPFGVVPPTTWIPPAGAQQNTQGGWLIPPPPLHGFIPPQAPTTINQDGSIVMAPLPAGVAMPTNAVVNADGTYTMPPPPFIGQVGAGGVIQANIATGQAPVGYSPVVQTGFTLPGTYQVMGGYLPPLQPSISQLPPPPAATINTYIPPIQVGPVYDQNGVLVTAGYMAGGYTQPVNAPSGYIPPGSAYVPPPTGYMPTMPGTYMPPVTGTTGTYCVAPAVSNGSGGCVSPTGAYVVPVAPPTTGTGTYCVAPAVSDGYGGCVSPTGAYVVPVAPPTTGTYVPPASTTGTSCAAPTVPDAMGNCIAPVVTTLPVSCAAPTVPDGMGGCFTP